MIFDIIALVFTVLVTFLMMKKGGIRALVSLGSLVLSVVIALSVYPVLTRVVYSTEIPATVENNISSFVEEKYGTAEMEAIEAMPEFIQNALQGELHEQMQDIGATMAESVTKIIVEVLLFVLVVVVTKLLLALLTKALDIAVKLPVIKQFNELTGILCGLVISAVFLWLASMFMGAVATSNESVIKIIDGSHVISFMNTISLF